MNISGSNYINNSVLKSLTDKTQKITDEKNEALAPQPSADEIVTARKYDVLEKSRDYEDMKLTEEPEEELSEADRIRKMFSVTETMSKMFSELFQGRDGFNEDNIVEICGAIGSEIDKSYTSGRLTKEEFDILNEELDEYSEALTERTVLLTAWGNFIKDNIKEDKKRMYDIIEQRYQEKRFQRFLGEMEKIKSSRPKKNELAALWEEYINSYDIDRGTLMDRIRNARINTGSGEDIINKWGLNADNAERMFDASDSDAKEYATLISMTYKGLKAGKGYFWDN